MAIHRPGRARHQSLEMMFVQQTRIDKFIRQIDMNRY